jgi:hypothetical protein
MQLPNASQAVVDRYKITDYLLNPAHRFGASKERFFTHFGFDVEKWEQLAKALHEHAQGNSVTKKRETRFGTRFEVEGRLNCPNGRRPRVRSVWQLDEGAVAPRLLTAYPLEAE